MDYFESLSPPSPHTYFSSNLGPFIALHDRISNPYSTPANPLILQMNYFILLDPEATDSIWNKFKQWMHSSTSEVQFFYFKEEMRKSNVEIASRQPTPPMLCLLVLEFPIPKELAFDQQDLTLAEIPFE